MSTPDDVTPRTTGFIGIADHFRRLKPLYSAGPCPWLALPRCMSGLNWSLAIAMRLRQNDVNIAISKGR